MTEFKCCMSYIAFGNVLVILQVKTGRKMAWKCFRIMQNLLSA